MPHRIFVLAAIVLVGKQGSIVGNSFTEEFSCDITSTIAACTAGAAGHLRAGAVARATGGAQPPAQRRLKSILTGCVVQAKTLMSGTASSCKVEGGSADACLAGLPNRTFRRMNKEV